MITNQGYPTIKIFYPDGRVEDYNGGRTASDLVAQAMILFEDVAEPPELHQLTSKQVLEDTCNNAQVRGEPNYQKKNYQ